MFDPETAQQIVRTSVKQVTPSANYASSKPLGAMGINTPSTLSNFKLHVRAEVTARGQTLDASKLDSTTQESTGGSVETIVRNDSVSSTPTPGGNA